LTRVRAAAGSSGLDELERHGDSGGARAEAVRDPLAEPAAARLESLAAESAPEEFVTVVDLTHGRALVRITGQEAAGLLARLCGVDLHDDMTPNGAAFRASVAGIATGVIRDDRAGAPSYFLHCERSSGQYLFDALVGAGVSLGIGIDGFSAPGI
jgi:heterotetrameric sarcosine oxidase gamma subunit